MSEVIDINQGREEQRREEPRTEIEEYNTGEDGLDGLPKEAETVKEPPIILYDGQNQDGDPALPKEGEDASGKGKIEEPKEDFWKALDVPALEDPKEDHRSTMAGISSSVRNWYLALLAAVAVSGGAIYATRGTSEGDKKAIEELKSDYSGLDGKVNENKSAIDALGKDLENERTTRADKDKNLADGIVAETVARKAADEKLAAADKKLAQGLTDVNNRLEGQDARISTVSNELRTVKVDMQQYAALGAKFEKLRSDFEAAKDGLNPADRSTVEAEIVMLQEAIRRGDVSIEKIEKAIERHDTAFRALVEALKE